MTDDDERLPLDEWQKLHPSFKRLHDFILNRMHKKIDYAMRDLNSLACQDDPSYHAGWNAGLRWAHRIVDGDKSAD